MILTIAGFAGRFEIATYRRRGWLPRGVTVVTYGGSDTYEGEALLTSNSRRRATRLLRRRLRAGELDFLRTSHRDTTKAGRAANTSQPTHPVR